MSSNANRSFYVDDRLMKIVKSIFTHNSVPQLFMFKAHGLKTCPNKVNVYFIFVLEFDH